MLKKLALLCLLASISFLWGCATCYTWNAGGGGTYFKEYWDTERDYALDREAQTFTVSTETTYRQYWVPFDFNRKFPYIDRIEKKSVTLPLDGVWKNSAVYRMKLISDSSMPLRKEAEKGIPLYVPKDTGGYFNLKYDGELWTLSKKAFVLPEELRLNPKLWSNRLNPFFCEGSGRYYPYLYVLLIPYQEKNNILSVYAPDFSEELPSYDIAKGRGAKTLAGFGPVCWRILWTPASVVLDAVTFPLQAISVYMLHRR